MAGRIRHIVSELHTSRRQRRAAFLPPLEPTLLAEGRDGQGPVRHAAPSPLVQLLAQLIGYWLHLQADGRLDERLGTRRLDERLRLDPLRRREVRRSREGHGPKELRQKYPGGFF